MESTIVMKPVAEVMPEIAGNVWRSGPLVPIEYYVPEFLSRHIGLTTITRDNFFGTLAFALAEDGTMINGLCQDARPINREHFLTHLLFRAHYFDSKAEIENNPCRRALCLALAERYWYAHTNFANVWPDTITEAHQILLGANIRYSPYSIIWEPDTENPFRFPLPYQPVSLSRQGDDLAQSVTKRGVRLSLAVVQLLFGGNHAALESPLSVHRAPVDHERQLRFPARPDLHAPVMP